MLRRLLPRWRVRNATAETQATLSLVFQLPFETSHIGVAAQPLTFTVQHATHHGTAAMTTVATLGTTRWTRGGITTGTVAKRF